MGKKCIPGSNIYCIENMTLFVLFMFLLIIGYLYYIFLVKGANSRVSSVGYMSSPNTGLPLLGVATRNVDNYNGAIGSPNVIMDPYGPPLRNDGYYFPRDSADIRGNIPLVSAQIPVVVTPQTTLVYAQPRGVAINVETRGIASDYTQLGILTRSQNTGDDMILSLMGRRIVTGLDKWQYYTISNTGNMNTKLPVSLNGRSCSGEYGCDSINNGDMVFVEGYNDTFRVTMYENSRFNYIPFI